MPIEEFISEISWCESWKKIRCPTLPQDIDKYLSLLVNVCDLTYRLVSLL